MNKPISYNLITGIIAMCAIAATSATAMIPGDTDAGSALPGIAKKMKEATVTPPKSGSSGYFNGTLYGTMVVSADWSPSEDHTGLYRINPDLSKELLYENVNMKGSASVHINGKMYYASAVAYSTFVVNNTLLVYDTEKLCPVGGYSMPLNISQVATGFAYDRMRDKAYAVTYNSNGSSYQLNDFDYENHVYTPICGLNETFCALTFSPDGILYGINKSGVVKTISLEDGTTEEIADTGLTPMFIQSATWSPLDNAILWAATLDYGEGALVRIDPATGSVENITALNDEIIGLYTTDTMAREGAPATPSDVEAGYPQPGSNLAHISFTMPSVTSAGMPLAGELDVTIVTDGNEAGSAKGKGKAGELFGMDVDLASPGTHRLAIYVGNEEGTCQPAIMKAYAGYDTPTKPENLTHTLSETGLVTLSWSPSEAMHNGHTGEITYHIVRNGTEIASTTETVFSETLDNTMRLYSYRVVPEANGVTGEEAADETFVFGDAVELPYSEGFTDPATFLMYETVDANDDGNTWTLSDWTGCAVYQKNQNKADDYLVSPPFMTEANHTYSLSFDCYLDYSGNAEELSVLFTEGCDLQSVSEGSVLIDKEQISEAEYEKRRIEVTFTPSTSGAGHFAWHVTSDPDCWKLNISGIMIKDLGNISAPKAVDDLKAVSAGEGITKAYISFTAPTETVGGNPVGEISAIELLRDGELLHTFSNVGPGEKKEYEDETEKPAFHTYSVAVSNASGQGDDASVTIYVGSHNTPVAFLDPEKESDFNLFTIDDANADGCTWRWDEDSHAAAYVQDEEGFAEDFLFTPMTELLADKIYEISYDAHVTDGSNGFILLTRLSRTLDRSDILTYYPANVVRSCNDFERVSKFIMVPENGTYSIAIASNVIMGKGEGIYIRNISINEGPAAGTPAAVTDLSIIPADKGELKATINFTMPYSDIMGTPLDDSDPAGIRVYDEGGELRGELPASLRAGETGTLHITAAQGVNTFTVRAYNSHGEGDRATCVAFCGIDTPFRVENVYSYPSPDNMSTTLKWDVPTEGSEKGWFNADELEYHIYLTGENGNTEEIAKTGDLEFTFNVSDGTLRRYDFGILPSTSAGKGVQIHPVTVQLGTPYAVPFTEKFSGGECSTSPWISETILETTSWDVLSDFGNIHSDDNGFLVFHDRFNISAASMMFMPKFSLENIHDAKLNMTIWQYYQAQSGYRLYVTSDGNNYEPIGVCYSDGIEEIGETAWKTFSFDLSSFGGARWLQVAIEGMISTEHYGAIDEISVTSESAGVSKIFSTAGVRAAGCRGMVVVTGAGGKYISMTSMDGRVVYAGKAETDRMEIRIPSGVYVVTADGNLISKVAVR